MLSHSSHHVMKQTLKLTTGLAALAGLATSAFAGDTYTGSAEGGKLVIDDAKPAFITPTLDTRFRYEYADFQGLNIANAATVRNRVGLKTAKFNGFQAYAEYEGTLALDRSDYFSPGASVPPYAPGPLSLSPNRTGVIADPESHEVNQLWVSYDNADAGYAIKVGRQAIALGNQRFVGGVAWRQNMQTYDAATITYQTPGGVELYYGYINQVNRIFGSEVLPIAGQTDFDGNSHLIEARFGDLPFGKLTAYAYLLDLTNQIGGSAASSNTFGAYLSGDLAEGLSYYAEFAYQTDAYDNPIPNGYSADYQHVALTGKFAGITTTAGFERLGAGFTTPLGTNHKFNGFADLTIPRYPAAGLSDLYVSATTKVGGVKVVGAFHHFQDQSFDTTFGNEFDLVLVKKISDNVTLLGKGAWFFGSSGAADRTRLSIEANIKY